MEPLVDTIIEDPRWDALNLSALADRAASAVMLALGLPEQGFTLCLMGCDDAHIAGLNADFRGKPQPTNVLSWPSEDRAPDHHGDVPDLPEPGGADDPESLGDIAISFETCMKEAAHQQKSPQDHVTHLVVHGILHLFGYDHTTDADALVMETLETRVLETLGIANPYE
jgi:probable rRNA maturation factor